MTGLNFSELEKIVNELWANLLILKEGSGLALIFNNDGLEWRHGQLSAWERPT